MLPRNSLESSWETMSEKKMEMHRAAMWADLMAREMVAKMGGQKVDCSVVWRA